MNIPDILARRAVIADEYRSLLVKHPSGEVPAEVTERLNAMDLEADQLNEAERRQARLNDLDRTSPGAVAIETRGNPEEGVSVFGLLPEQRMSDFLARRAGIATPSLSVGRAVRGMITGSWDGAEAERRTMGTSPGSTGGFLMPDPISASLIDLARNASTVVAAGALTIPMTSQTMTIIQVLSDPTAAWRAEGAAITESDGTFSALNLHAYSLAAMVRVNNELLDDVPTFAATLDNQLAAILALKLDNAALYGNGVGKPLGLRYATGVEEVSMGANGLAQPDYEDVLDLIQAIEENNGSPDTLVMAPRSRMKLAKLTHAYTALLPAPDEYKALRKLISNQVSITEVQGSSGAISSSSFMGGFQNMALAIRQSITVEASRVADDTFAKNQTLVRAIMRADVAILRPSHLGRLIGIL